MPQHARSVNQKKNDVARKRLWGGVPGYLESRVFSLKEIREQQQALRAAFYARKAA